jgi:alcohol dehydrogenase
VLGDGKLGLLIAQALHAQQHEVHLFGRNAAKLAIAERAGVHVSQGPLPRHEFEAIVEATGSADGLSEAVAAVRPRGTVIMKSTVHGTAALDTAAVVVNEIRLVGSRCGRFEPALALLAHKRIDVDSLVSKTMPLTRAPEAFEYAAKKGVLKVLLKG